jgi:hypothetical protein
MLCKNMNGLLCDSEMENNATTAITGTVGTTGTTAIETTATEITGTTAHTYRPIPQGFMGYGSSGAWDQCNIQ